MALKAPKTGPRPKETVAQATAKDLIVAHAALQGEHEKALKIIDEQQVEIADLKERLAVFEKPEADKAESKAGKDKVKK